VKPSAVAVGDENTGVLGTIKEVCVLNPSDEIVFKYSVPGVAPNSFTALSVIVQVLLVIASHAVVLILKFATTE
jgi:Ni,Fe-hydrogenase III small subunit